ncbi:DMT family transporter [Aliiroseovarius sp. S1123]|jgi:drug/metabolite transporter (DMT)-like permease|uniref:DMT family transporter n=1 Tax=unclassified Aliiroseovarius TaxID=2623558 RepID=UPI001FF43A70|nr:DMT family transporter [Aliiroseovarius sp. S1123]MCK0170040.1 DMT family transporter [Aliiroseovarius sp. S1123]
MQAWIPITILAAFSQNLRFMLQKRLKDTRLSATGATFARFVYSAPLVAVLMAGYFTATGLEVPQPDARFFAFAFTGGIAQILATICVVALFAERNFAVGITFKKTEVVLTALTGLLVLGEGVGMAGALAIGIGFFGLILLSDPPEGGKGWRRFFNKAAALGLSAGLLFSFSAIGYRGASLSLGVEDVVARAGFTLAVVTAFQSLIMAGWMVLREKGEVTRVLASWRVGVLVGLSSMVGSFCWFTAFTLQNAALVKALGQVELLFSYAATLFVFREKVSGREYAGTALILASVLVLVLYLK